MTYTQKAGNTEFKAKWTENLEFLRFTQIPNILLTCQEHLELKEGELLTLIHLISFWFGDKSSIYPSIKTLKSFSGKSYPTIQKRLKSLEDKGFINRVHRFGTSNIYDLSKCVRKLEEHSRVCAATHRKQSDWYITSYAPLPSVTITKEDQLRKTELTKTENVIGKPQNDIFSLDFSQWDD